MGMGCVNQTGEVVSVRGGVVRVRMEVSSACSACRSRRMCGVDESSPREVEVRSGEGKYSVGDSVRVEMQSRHGFLAVFLGYVLPFLVVFLVLLFLIAVLGVGEGVGAIGALLGLALYYTGLHFARGFVSRRFDFKISHLG